MLYTNAHETYKNNAQQLAQFGEQLDEFVNNNAGNVECDNEDAFLQQLAARNVIITQADSTALPVICYLHEGKFVAWYDDENCYGYIA